MTETPSLPIKKIRIAPASSDSIETETFVSIRTSDTFDRGQPRAGGMLDLRMGTTTHEYNCETCNNPKANCLGHSGKIELNYPVFNIPTAIYCVNWLRLICFNCKQPVIGKSALLEIEKQLRFDVAVTYGTGDRKTNKVCNSCGKHHGIIRKDDSDQYKLYAEYNSTAVPPADIPISDIIDQAGRKLGEKYIIMPHYIKSIFDEVSDDTVLLFFDNTLTHPRNCILTRVKILPATARPDARNIRSGKTSTDPLSLSISSMINDNSEISTSDWSEINVSQKSLVKIYKLNSSYVSFIADSAKPGSSSRDNAPRSLLSRTKGKTGLIRNNIEGKRVFYTFRATISGNPLIGIDEVGIPLRFARNIQVEEVITDFNRRKMRDYINNGRDRYPGCTRIIKGSNGREYSIGAYSSSIIPEVGDTVMRDIVDGDYIMICRQPSIKISNVAAHRVKIIYNPSILTICINGIACPFYDADFDGDAMNGFINTGIAAMSEIRQLSKVSNWLISYAEPTPIAGQVDDSVIGMALLTKTGVEFDRRHFASLFVNCKKIPKIPDSDRFTGRDAISQVLEDTPLTFNGPTTYYNKDHANSGRVNYNPDDIEVVIKSGKHIKGILDKRSIGKKAANGLYHMLANEYNGEIALEKMFATQQLAHNYLYQKGFTIGIRDMMLPDSAIVEIKKIEGEMLKGAQIIIDELNKGNIVPPPEKTIRETFEERMIAALRSLDPFAEPVFKNIDIDMNGLMQLIMTGSKGGPANMYHIVSAIGQILISGERPESKKMRASPYYPRNDLDPRAAGFILSSYIGGLNPAEMYANAKNGRNNIIIVSQATSQSGYLYRKSIKSMEPATINNMGMVEFGGKIAQIVYGEDGIDARRLVRAQINHIMISNADFADKFTISQPDLKDLTGGKGAKVDEVFIREAESLKRDRDEYREIFMRIENSNEREIITNVKNFPVNAEQIVKSITEKYSAEQGNNKPSLSELVEMTKKVQEFCDHISDTVRGSAVKRRNPESPPHIKNSMWLFGVYVRSCLCAKQCLIHIKMEILHEIIAAISNKCAISTVNYGTAVGIIAAQAFGAPFTQYMLDAKHRSVAGGTSKKVVDEINDTLSSRSVKDMKLPMMTFELKPEYAKSEAQVRKIASQIEMLKLGTFVSNMMLFYETYGNPVHPKFKHEKEMIRNFERLNPLLVDKIKDRVSEFYPFCIRFEVDRRMLIYKNTSLEDILIFLHNEHPDIHAVHTSENDSEIIVRLYFEQTTKKGMAVSREFMLERWRKLYDSTVRGVPGITVANAISLARHVIDEKGAVVPDTQRFGIRTEGINLPAILRIKAVDPNKIYSNSMVDMAKYYGIESARQRLIYAIRYLGPGGTNYQHTSVYADVMTLTGRITDIDITGVSARDRSNILHRIGYINPMRAIVDAAVKPAENEIKGLTASLLMGTTPSDIGTNRNGCQMIEHMIKENIENPDDWIKEMGYVG